MTSYLFGKEINKISIKSQISEFVQTLPEASVCIRTNMNASKQVRMCPLEDRKYGYFWIFPHHSCENIQKYFEFLDIFGYSPIIPEQLSDVLGGAKPPPLNFGYGLRNNGGVSKSIQKFKIFLDILTAMMGEYPKISIFSVF